MAGLLRNCWLHRALLAAFLIALGAGIYQITPPSPTCEINTPPNGVPFFFADTGRRLITRSQAILFPGPLNIWDTRTGERIASYTKVDDAIPFTAFSRDGRYLAAEIHREVRVTVNHIERLDGIILIDTLAGAERVIPLEENENRHGHLQFSPDGNFLARVSLFDTKGLRIFEIASGAPIAATESSGLAANQDPGCDVLLHYPNNREFGGVEAWSWHTRRPLGLLEHAGTESVQSPDGRFYVAERMPAEGKQFGRWGVWNLQTLRLEGEFKSDDMRPGLRTISGDGRWLAASCRGEKGNYLELRELPRGRLVATCPVHLVVAMKFSPDGRFLLVEGVHPEATQTMLETPSLNALWQQDRPGNRGAWGGVRVIDSLFSRDSNTLFTDDRNDPDVICLDTMTGKPRSTVRLNAKPMTGQLNLEMTPDRRSLLVIQTAGEALAPGLLARMLEWLPQRWQRVTSNDTVVVLDADTCSEHFRLVGWNTTSALLSDDGGTLVTVHDEETGRILRCWDVKAWKPLRWAVGVPAGMGPLVVGLIWWRRRRHRIKPANS